MTETLAGRAAALLLALIWLASMGMTDINAYSFLPIQVGLVAVILLVLSSLIRGARAVRLSKTAWASLAVGVYFLVRCLCSFDVVSAWREASLILACGVFYVAGVYAAQGRSLRLVACVLGVGLLLNLGAFVAMRYSTLPMEWLGRPSFSPGGENHRPVSLFVYKNQAGAFFAVSGFLLLSAAFWARTWAGALRLIYVLLGGLCMALSGCCGTRAVYLLAPVMLLVMLVLEGVNRLCAKERDASAAPLVTMVVLLSAAGLYCAVSDVSLIEWISTQDSHSRFAVWKCCCCLLPDAPWWGYGAYSVPWLLAPSYHGSIGLVNAAHNEYLQAWVDYGLLGLGGVLFVIGAHAVRGFWALCSEKLPEQQRCLVSLSLLCLLSWFVAGTVDFFWHHATLASMTAFSAGVLASPYPREDARRGSVPGESTTGKAVLAFLGFGSMGVALYLAHVCWAPWSQQWAYNRLSLDAQQDSNGDARAAMLQQLLPGYPSHRLLDEYYHLPVAREMTDEEEGMLRLVLRANPRQIFMAVMLSRWLTEHARYAEAELLLRRYYEGDGMLNDASGLWANFYVDNLLRRGHDEWLRGNITTGYSCMAYALRLIRNMHLQLDKGSTYAHHLWNPDARQVEYWKTYLAARKQDVTLMKILGIVPDDSWMQPMEPDGKPALYRRYGLADEAEREAVAEEERRAGRLH